MTGLGAMPPAAWLRNAGFGVAGAVAMLLCWAGAARAGDRADQFKRGTKIVSVQVGGGVQNNVEGHEHISNIAFVNLMPRVSVLPFDPVGSGWLEGSAEIGLEPWFQYYLEPETATAEGLKVGARYHFLRASPVFPYLEVTAGVGASSLNVLEIQSPFTFVLEGGAGVSYFVSEGVAVTAGYRFQHLSNGGQETPNQGVNSDTGLAGVSFFFH